MVKLSAYSPSKSPPFSLFIPPNSIRISPAFTPYTPSWLSCARWWSAVSSFAPPVGSVFAATPRVLLCLLPTGSPMTPASWGVRRMPFGYFCVVQSSAISRRASSFQWLNSRRIRRVNPRLFLCLFPRIVFGYPPPLHPTLPLGCLVHGGGPPCPPLLHPLVLYSRLPREFFYVYYPRGPR